MFDFDGSGQITVDEIIRVVGGKGDENEIEAWQEMIERIDLDGNGEISFDEFKCMMLQLASNENY